MSLRDEAIEIIRDNDDLTSAAKFVYDGPKRLALYVIQLGLETLKSKRRRQRRRELKAEIQPQYTSGKTFGSIVLTKKSKERLLRNTQELFGDNGWKIGNLQLGAWTKEQLLVEAAREESAAKGHIQNAKFYRALAEPLKPGQRVDEYWNQKDGVKLKKSIWKETESAQPALV